VGTVKSTISRAVAKLRIDTELLCDFGDQAPRGALSGAAEGEIPALAE
jgi:hypothetical protein